MKKFIKTIDVFLSFICVVIFIFISIGYINQPEQIVFYEDFQSMRFMNVYTVKKNDDVHAVSLGADDDEVSADISLLGVFPVTKTKAIESDRKYVAIGGDLIGIRIYTDGLLVVGLDNVITSQGNVSPAKECGLEIGDRITHVNDEIITSVAAFSAVLSMSEGNNISLTVERNDDTFYYSLKPVFCEAENKYRCGLWLKDSTAGIGTLTFSDPQTGMFASLGHAICDAETKSVLTVSDGDILGASVSGCTKGEKGSTGQIKGSFTGSDLGDIAENNEFGVYGTINDIEYDDDLMLPVASQGEIQTGAAKIYATVSGDGVKEYDIEIEKINYSNEPESRSLVISITDSELLESTGGIIQGMSGSPIVQNGMFVGAVTHVFLNDPTRGYGIFAETMINEAERIIEQE